MMKCFEKRKSEICGHLLVKASRLFFTRSVNEVIEKRGLNITEHHFRVFPYVDHEGTTITDIAKRMKISKQAVSKLIHTLVEEGIFFYAPGKDKREKLVKFKSGSSSPFSRSLDYLEKQDEVFAKILGSKKDLKKMKEYLLLIQNHFMEEN